MKQDRNSNREFDNANAIVRIAVDFQESETIFQTQRSGWRAMATNGRLWQEGQVR